MDDFWYDRPAERWTEALPLGNGRIGVMDDGGLAEQTFWLNEDTFWSGYPRQQITRSKAEIFRRVRDLTAREKIAQAEELFRRELSGPNGESYQSGGALHLILDALPEGAYRRSLSFRQGVSRVRAGVQVREALVSWPSQVFALHLADAAPFSLTLRLDAPIRYRVYPNGDGMAMTVEAPSSVEPSYSNVRPEAVCYDPAHPGMKAVVALEVRQKDGSRRWADGVLRVENASDVTILLAIRTGFRGWDRLPDVPEAELLARCCRDLAQAPDFETLLETQEVDIAAFYDRVDLHLDGPDRPDLPTDRRIREYRPDEPDMGLLVGIFNYARYLLIAGSRPGTQALNLQGIWNREVRPPWSSNYTLNINTQMNYWPVLPLGLPEMQEPLFDLLADLAENGKTTARLLYGAPGFAVHHNTDLWRFTTPVGEQAAGCTSYGFWNLSGGWLCNQLFERWRYTLDRAFLEKLYPILRACEEFYEALLTEENGRLYLSPGTSPENNFRTADGRHCLDRSTAMGQEIFRQLLENCLCASETLGQDGDKYEHRIGLLKRLAQPEIDSRGALTEWHRERTEAEPDHRHLSHLYGIYPGRTLLDDPERKAAARTSLELRGDEATGWSIAWKACQWARQGDGDHALRLLSMQLRPAEAGEIRMQGGGSYPNGFCAHPPFQIDGNFGFGAAVCEMLLGSWDETIRLLPTLPKAWSRGRVRGLQAAGRVRVDLSWQDGHGKALLTAERPQERRVRLPDGREITAELTPERPAELNW